MSEAELEPQPAHDAGRAAAGDSTVLPPLALSSMWHQRFPDPADLGAFLNAGRDIGFRHFELSHDVPPEALEALADGGIAFASVHHPCPRPPDYDARDHACHPDPDHRSRFAAGMRRTIDTARALGASAIMVHLGRLEDEPLRKAAFEVSSRFSAGQASLAAYREALDRLGSARDRAEDATFDHARSTLKEILPYAEDHGVSIGLETGYHPWEAPSPNGMSRLLEALDPTSATLGAWLDTGHAAARAMIGLDPWQDWRDAVAGRWIGAHFHDIVGLRDHLAPGVGWLDFASLGSWLPPSAKRTLEVDWYLSAAEVWAGADHLARTGCAAPLTEIDGRKPNS